MELPAKIEQNADPAEDWRTVNAIIDWLHALKRCKIIPDKAGAATFPEILDLSGFVTKEEARRAGMNV